MHEIIIHNHHFLLLADKAVFWKEQEWLLISDVHLGKITHFRKNGSPLPPKAEGTELAVIERLIVEWKPKELLFLGDLFHSEINSSWHVFAEWVEEVSQLTDLHLIAGNHDIIDHGLFRKIGIAVSHEISCEGFLLTHKPTGSGEAFNICGHIHPAVKLRGAALQSMKVACFCISPKRMIMPAFGKFTGTHVLSPKTSEKFYGIAENKVIEL